MKNKVLAFIIFVILLKGNCLAGDPRNGNWWRTLNELEKNTYITGFFDGMELGNNFSVWDIKKEETNCFLAATNSFNSLCEKYFSHVTNGQIADGLDSFYEDYRNRKILTVRAAWIVVRSISGETEKDLEEAINNFRKNAQ